MEGIPMPITQQQFGHVSLAATDRYLAHIAPKQVIETMGRGEWAPMTEAECPYGAGTYDVRVSRSLIHVLVVSPSSMTPLLRISLRIHPVQAFIRVEVSSIHVGKPIMLSENR